MLAMICGADQTLNELLSAAIKEHQTLGGVPDGFAWAIVKKTIAAKPAECGKQLTLAEKIKSTVSIVDCNGTNVIAINVVDESCSCLICGDELPCSLSSLSFEQKVIQTLVYTTDGEWAWHLINVTPA